MARWSALPGNTRGAIHLLMTAILLGAVAYAIRMAGRTVPSFEIIFFRNTFILLVLLPLALWPRRPNGFRTAHLGLHLARGSLSFLSMTAFYWSYINLPLAESTALMYTMPLFLIVLAVAFTGERVGWRRTTATIVGFMGVIMMLSPGMGAFETALLVPLTIGLIDSVIALVIKRLTRTETLLSILLYMCSVTFAGSLIVLALGTFVIENAAFARLARWTTPSVDDLALLGLVALLSGSAQIFNVLGWRAGETTAIAPMSYMQIVFAGAVGYFAFEELPAVWTMLGALVIVGSTAYIAHREARLQRRAAAR
jgi:drug/metabolite transporter (DMT)-like permease